MKTTLSWKPDLLGDDYQQHTIILGLDPDGEGEVEATLVRRTAPADPRGVVLYVHGFADYFFQTELADFFTGRGAAFYALDLRKCGRARRPGQTAHYVSDLAFYDNELDRSLDLVAAEHPGLPITVVAHSTGGLIVPLWLDRRRRNGQLSRIDALVLNSPWLDQQGSAMLRGPVTWALVPLARVIPQRVLPAPPGAYGSSIHITGTGEWDFDTTLKPLRGFPVTVGWLNAVRRAHRRIHRGIEVGVPTLVLHSAKTHFSRTHSDLVDRADAVLDVRQIARWAPHLGAHVTVVVIPDARHDVFLSQVEPKTTAYRAVTAWLDGVHRSE
ncbi:alpha/beta hydrolase [Kribbella sp. CA-293567]|uniref:alpha/beta hydrolase n=1 Tax=Kribbella sp. CA-293567 TaxID=3002436 RepID=UPI0022DCE82F|nr:alpha/beta hydrolase [Kribbella sp. CA-293567]WBQ07388.1 alpha/beta hydrolase [Kribbella sp. CA-293567]